MVSPQPIFWIIETVCPVKSLVLQQMGVTVTETRRHPLCARSHRAEGRVGRGTLHSVVCFSQIKTHPLGANPCRSGDPENYGFFSSQPSRGQDHLAACPSELLEQNGLKCSARNLALKSSGLSAAALNVASPSGHLIDLQPWRPSGEGTFQTGHISAASRN